KAYGTLLMISDTTRALVRDVVDTRELDLMTVKGKEQPITVYEVLDVKGTTPEVIIEAAEAFEEGLALYRSRRFHEAKEVFARACELRPDDGPSLTYGERCDVFIAHPPPEDWDGIWHMKEK